MHQDDQPKGIKKSSKINFKCWLCNKSFSSEQEQLHHQEHGHTLDEALSSNADPSLMLSKRSKKSEPNLTQTTLFEKRKSKSLIKFFKTLSIPKAKIIYHLKRGTSSISYFDNPKA